MTGAPLILGTARGANLIRFVATAGPCIFCDVLRSSMTISGFSRTKALTGIGDLCPRCGGLLNWQWNVALRVEELHCLTCGNVPHQWVRRADGVRVCRECRVRPVTQRWKPESDLCAGCLVRRNAQRRRSE